MCVKKEYQDVGCKRGVSFVKLVFRNLIIGVTWRGANSPLHYFFSLGIVRLVTGLNNGK
jgi:hypothetical protein